MKSTHPASGRDVSIRRAPSSHDPAVRGEEDLAASLRWMAERFHRAREESGLSLRALAERAGVAASTPGDTLHFKGDIAHTWHNPGPEEAEIIMVCAFDYR